MRHSSDNNISKAYLLMALAYSAYAVGGIPVWALCFLISMIYWFLSCCHR